MDGAATRMITFTHSYIQDFCSERHYIVIIIIIIYSANHP